MKNLFTPFILFSLFIFLSCQKDQKFISENITLSNALKDMPNNLIAYNQNKEVITDFNELTINNKPYVLDFKARDFIEDKDINPVWCCQVGWVGYQAPPFPVPGDPRLITFRYSGYTVNDASGYFNHWTIQRKLTGSNNWKPFHDHVWLGFERPCDGSQYGVGLQIYLGVCEAEFRATLNIGHFDSNGNMIYCTGDSGEFHYEGDTMFACF